MGVYRCNYGLQRSLKQLTSVQSLGATSAAEGRETELINAQEATKLNRLVIRVSWLSWWTQVCLI